MCEVCKQDCEFGQWDWRNEEIEKLKKEIQFLNKEYRYLQKRNT